MEAGEFHDWELLHSDSHENLKELEVFEGDSEGMIRSDYFSLDSHNKYQRIYSRTDVDDGSVESENPSWIDPGSDDLQFRRKNSKDFWSDSGSDRDVDRTFDDPEPQNELVFSGNVMGEVGFEEIGEIQKNDLGFSENVMVQVGFEEVGENQTHDDDRTVLTEFENTEKDSEVQCESKEPITEFDGADEDSRGSKEADSSEIPLGNENVAIHGAKNLQGDEEKKGMVWWKLPLEMLKYCVLRLSPVWSLSVAGAVIGFILLGRRLYNMKRKTRTLQLKVTMDDKNVSQFMTRAARLNEAFSVVRRVPIIRPSMPAAGMTPWPVMSLR